MRRSLAQSCRQRRPRGRKEAFIHETSSSKTFACLFSSAAAAVMPAPSGSSFSEATTPLNNGIASAVNNNSNNNHSKRPIYVAATHQHVGKTSVSLALLSGLLKRFDHGKVGFVKPVGQKHLVVNEQEGDGVPLKVDKDVALVRQHFRLDHLGYKSMSPVLIPPGYTKDYLDGKITLDEQQALIQQAHEAITKQSQVVLCEGTGHCAVGSIVGAGNAQVASWLHADMVLVANGGLGRAFDELELNRVLCLHFGVNIAGVIINKVQVDKYEQTKHYLTKALEKEWGVPLLGCIPDRPFLGCPALADLEKLFDTTLVSGHAHRFRHFTVQDLNLVATSLGVFLENLRHKPTRTLYVCHSSQDDILLGFLGEYQRRGSAVGSSKRHQLESALIVCEAQDLDPTIVDMMDLQQDESGSEHHPPILCVKQTSEQAMEMIRSYTPKLNIHDTSRVASTVQHYEPYIDFDLLLQRTGHVVPESRRAL